MTIGLFSPFLVASVCLWHIVSWNMSDIFYYLRQWPNCHPCSILSQKLPQASLRSILVYGSVRWQQASRVQASPSLMDNSTKAAFVAVWWCSYKCTWACPRFSHSRTWKCVLLSCPSARNCWAPFCDLSWLLWPTVNWSHIVRHSHGDQTPLKASSKG